MNGRRDFLKMTGLASASLFVPNFLAAQASRIERRTGKALVIIQLDGGNDGLNTIIPFRNDLYYGERSRVAISASDALTMNDEMALHPSMQFMRTLYDKGELAVVNGVGYPEPNRSHFRSSDIWHTASDSNEFLSTGWVGRSIDEQTDHRPYNALSIGDKLNLALKGNEFKGLALEDPSRLYKQTQIPFLRSVAEQDHHLEHHHSVVDYLHRTFRETTSSAEYVFEKSKVYSSSISYPTSKLAKGLRTIAELIISGSDTSVYYVSQSGFDTHAGQLERHKRLLKEYDSAVEAFVKDLKKNNRFKDVAIMTFSEFGRRVQQNASGGTDHGAANCSWFIGGSLKNPGIVNPLPDLSDLDKGDLKHTVDFRQLYATLLERWLGQDSATVLGRHFAPLSFI